MDLDLAREHVREVNDTRYALHSRAISQGINTVAGSEDSVQRAMKNEPVSQAMSFLCTSKEVMPFQTLNLLCGGICMLPSFQVSKDEFRLANHSRFCSAGGRVFSQANLILTDGRIVLDAELAGKIASLGSWFRELGIGK